MARAPFLDKVSKARWNLVAGSSKDQSSNNSAPKPIALRLGAMRYVSNIPACMRGRVGSDEIIPASTIDLSQRTHTRAHFQGDLRSSRCSWVSYLVDPRHVSYDTMNPKKKFSVRRYKKKHSRQDVKRYDPVHSFLYVSYHTSPKVSYVSYPDRSPYPIR